MRLLWGPLTRCSKPRRLLSASPRQWRAAPTPGNSHFKPSLAAPEATPRWPVRVFSTTSQRTAAHTPGGSQDDYFLATFSDSTRPPSDNAQWESLLDRGLAYGIKTRGQLCQEADVGHMLDIGTRLTDNAPHRHDTELWEILLIAQALQNGHEGIKAIWRGMKFRGEAVRLDGDDPRMDPLYKTFLSAGSEDHQFLWSICKEIKQLSYGRRHLFAEIVGTALEGSQPMEARQFASFIGVKHYGGRKDLLKTFFAACQSRNPNALEGFRSVYEMVPRSCIYAEVTSSLWKQDRSADAFAMHSFLVLRNDLPTQFHLLEPFLNHLALHNESLEAFLSPLSTAGVSFDAQARRLWSVGRSRVTGVPSDSLNIVASKTMGATPTKLSDQFVARAFATGAFSFGFAVHSLRMIGLIEVGPLAIRQLATASPDLATLRARLQTLRELEIDTGASVFVRVLKNTIDAGHWEMVRTLVDNDLHHETFEDLGLQKRLLSEYYRKQDWRQLNRTLAILNDGRFDDSAKQRSANHLLLAAVKAEDWSSVVNRATSLLENGWYFARSFPRLITPLLAATALPKSSRRPTGWDVPAFVVGLMQEAMLSGKVVRVALWRQAMRGLGRPGRLEELESLIYWIAECFREGEINGKSLDTPTAHEPNALKLLFTDNFQKSLMSWCFRPHRGMHIVSAERCLRWTRILKKLRDGYGIEVKEHLIRWEFIKRLRRLFAPGARLKRPNMLMRHRNWVSLSQYWALYDKMWDMKAAQVQYNDRIEVCLRYRKLSRQKRRKLREHWLSQQGSRKAVPNDHDGQNNVQRDIVVYRDLFNASWADYRK